MKKSLLLAALTAICLTIPCQIAHAGEINGNEASVLAAARGSFEYEGKTYVAKQEYVNQLIAKMSADDVDLTAEQASEAIAEIYSNVAAGVKEGYLTEVSGSGTSGNGTSDSGQQKNDNSSEEDNPAGASSNPESTTPAGQENEPGAGDAEGQGDQGVLSEEVNVPSKGKFSLDMDGALKAVAVTEQSSPDEVRTVILKKYLQPVLKMMVVILTVLTLISLVLLCWKKKGKLKKIVPAGLGMVLLIAGIFIGATAAIMEFGFCSGKILVNRVAAEGYYKQVYATFDKQTGNILKSAGFPEDILDDLLDERTIYLDGKLALEASFNENRTKEFMNVQDSIKQTLMEYLYTENYSNVDELSDSLGNLAGIIQNCYTDNLKFTYTDQMKTEKEEGQKLCFRFILLGGVLCLLGIVVLILAQRYIHRIFRVIGWSSLMSAVTSASTAVYYLFTKKYESLGLVQQEYSSFFSGYLRWNAQLLIAVACLELVVYLICVAATLSLKKIHKRNPFQKLK